MITFKLVYMYVCMYVRISNSVKPMQVELFISFPLFRACVGYNMKRHSVTTYLETLFLL